MSDVRSAVRAAINSATAAAKLRATDKRSVLKRIDGAISKVQAEIDGNAQSGGFYGRGTASEGYAGGYLEALLDVQAALIHGYPNDKRGYWRPSVQDKKSVANPKKGE